MSQTAPIPRTPTDALASPVPLRPLLKPRILSLPPTGPKNRPLTAALPAGRHATARLAQGPIRWQASLTASLRSGWEPGAAGTGWRCIRSGPRPLRRLWALLDASRSTGAGQFLADACESLVSLFEARLRINLLLIHRGAIRWLARNATQTHARAALETLPDASGKSPLREALLRLNRALSAAQTSSGDTVCVCSDGLPTLSPGQTAAEAAQGLRSAVQRFERNPGFRGVWLCPAPGRAFTRWLDNVLAGSGFQRVHLAASAAR